MKKTRKDILVDKLIEVLDIENEFFKRLEKLIDIQLDDLLMVEDLELVHNYCKINFKSLIKRNKKLHTDFYSQFSENDIADIIIFHKSSAGIMLKQKSSELASITHDVIIRIMNDKKLNILIDTLVSESPLFDEEADNGGDDDNS